MRTMSQLSFNPRARFGRMNPKNYDENSAGNTTTLIPIGLLWFSSYYDYSTTCKKQRH